MKLTNIVFCLTLLAGVATSCIREDLDDCLSTNRLLLSYKGDGTTEIFPDKICRVEMFVFDAENRCVNSSILPKEQVESRTATLPPLTPGDYRIICLGNTHDTKVEGLATGDYDRMLFAAGDYFDRKQVSGNDSLYYATTSYTVLPYNGREEDDQTQIIEFASSHYDLLVEVAGVPATGNRAGMMPVLEICGVSPCTDFENRAYGEATDYLLETEYKAGLLTARTNIMRHKDHENVNVYLRSAPGGELLAEVNLAKFLADNPVIDCSKHEVLIPIRIEFKSGEITVSVPEWYIEHVKPEF
ncbi:FimB/Mfa2 family fimbrial subunit [Bacteroides sp. AN502(2024)]|uniref:FimB/Mfa2 family fimbrial subunit n=1 Tax=Bacteroides sp. AN502(2024) TaxID=3160599 RepID=UPI0035162339